MASISGLLSKVALAGMGLLEASGCVHRYRAAQEGGAQREVLSYQSRVDQVPVCRPNGGADVWDLKGTRSVIPRPFGREQVHYTYAYRLNPSRLRVCVGMSGSPRCNGCTPAILLVTGEQVLVGRNVTEERVQSLSSRIEQQIRQLGLVPPYSLRLAPVGCGAASLVLNSGPSHSTRRIAVCLTDTGDVTDVLGRRSRPASL